MRICRPASDAAVPTRKRDRGGLWSVFHAPFEFVPTFAQFSTQEVNQRTVKSCLRKFGKFPQCLVETVRRFLQAAKVFQSHREIDQDLWVFRLPPEGLLIAGDRVGQVIVFPVSVAAVEPGKREVRLSVDGLSVSGHSQIGAATILPSHAKVVERLRMTRP